MLRDWSERNVLGGLLEIYLLLYHSLVLIFKIYNFSFHVGVLKFFFILSLSMYFNWVIYFD